MLLYEGLALELGKSECHGTGPLPRVQGQADQGGKRRRGIRTAVPEHYEEVLLLQRLYSQASPRVQSGEKFKRWLKKLIIELCLVRRAGTGVGTCVGPETMT